MSAVIKIDFITYVETKTDWPEMPLQTAARVKNSADVACPQIVDAAKKGADGCGRIAKTKVYAAGFDGYEGTYSAVAEVQLGANFPMEDAHAAA
jgi:hypothetical protein